MNLAAYGLNVQISQTTLEYEARVKQVDKEDFKGLLEDKTQEELENNLPVLASNYLLSDEKALSEQEKAKKSVLEHVLSGFNLDAKSIKLIPNDAFSFSYEQNTANPYEKNISVGPNSMTYMSKEEYYEKTSMSFSGKALIETEDGEVFEIELNFSYSKEFYEQNKVGIAAMEKHVGENPLKLDSKEYEDSLKQLNSITLLFDVLNEQEEQENKTLFDYLKEQYLKNQKDLEEQEEKAKEKALEKRFDNFKISIKNSEEKFDLLAVQKDGVGFYLSSYKANSSSFELERNNNSTLMKASYSYSEINTYTKSKE